MIILLHLAYRAALNNMVANTAINLQDSTDITNNFTVTDVMEGPTWITTMETHANSVI